VILLCGCAAIFDGTSQDITVNTNPPGAKCDFLREGKVVGTIVETPASLTVRKTKYDLTIRCSKAGFDDATYLNHSGVAGATVADVLGGVVTGGAAWAIDSGTGADNKYDSVVNVSLAPKGLAAAAEAAAKAPAPAAVGAEPEAPAVAPPQAQ
jgi:hypothetical protein